MTPKPTQQPLHPCARANITLVSAFFDIGDHRKGGVTRHISEYLPFSQSLAFIKTPLVFYTDSEVFADHVTKLRSRLDPKLTHVIRVKRDSLWPFNLRAPIGQLYAQPGYPKHAPNTVVPDYSCAQHAKYACILDLILKRHDIIKTEVYAWLDFGYFRDLKDKQHYCMVLPQNFTEEKVSFNQVYLPNFKQAPKTIFYSNHVWVGGGMFLATRDTMVKFCIEYQRATEYLLFARNLSSTDQQTLYASFTEEGRRDINFDVELQVDPGSHGWFKLGFSCLHRMGNGTFPNLR
ncbi:uncharacterized protein [Littorina saxatilis]